MTEARTNCERRWGESVIGRVPSEVFRSDQSWVAGLEAKLEEERSRASSPPAEGFASTAEKAAWQSVERAMSRRLQRCVDSKVDLLRKAWELLPEKETFWQDTPPLRSTLEECLYYCPILKDPVWLWVFLEFKISMEVRKAKSIAEHMALWRSRAVRSSGSHLVKDLPAAVEEVAGEPAGLPVMVDSSGDAVIPAGQARAMSANPTATAELPMATGSDGDDATFAVKAEEEKAISPTATSAEEMEQELQPDVDAADDTFISLEEMGNSPFLFDLDFVEDLVLFVDPASEDDGRGEDSNSSNDDSSANDSSSSSSSNSSNNNRSSSSSNGSSGGTFVSRDGERKCPFDRGRSFWRSAGTRGDAVVGVAFPFDRGKCFGFWATDGAGQGCRAGSLVSRGDVFVNSSAIYKAFKADQARAR